MGKRLISIFAVVMMLSGVYMYARSVQHVSYMESEESVEDIWISPYDLEYLSEIMESMDFSTEESPVNTTIYNSELDKEYKTAFVKVLFGQAPIRDEEKGEYYFGEIMPDLNEYSNGIEMGDFMNVRYYIAITNRLNFYYMDFDGDGLPELITHYIRIEDDQDFGGPYILKYNPEDKQVYHFASADAAKWEPLGPGKLYYDDSDNTRYSYGSYGYQEINALGEVSRKIQFVPVYLSDGYVIVYIDIDDGTETSAKDITLKREKWNQMERDFLKAVDNAPACTSFDALFHDVDVNELIAEIPPIYPNKIEHFAYDTDNSGFQGNGKQENITYQVPLEEIAERIEYEYVYENMTDHIADQDYNQLSFLPSGEDIAISVYIVEGNKILFLPEEKANTDAMVNNEPCRLHYCEEADGYVFYILVDWQVSEMGIPVNSLENYNYYKIRECIVRDRGAVYEEVNPYTGDSSLYFPYEFELEDLLKLGDTKVTFDPEQTIELPEIPMEDNEYMDAVAEFAADILRKHGIYGNFRIYPETYGRVRGKYVDEPTRGKISAAIIGDGFEDYLFVEISEGGEINGDHVWPPYYPAVADSPTYFVEPFFLEDEPEDFIEKIVGLQRGVTELEVREDDALEEETDSTPYVAPKYDQDIDFHTMSWEETAELIRYVYSYGEWFGMNELGCMTGELRDLQDESIIMYRWKEGGGDNRVYFVPKSKVNTYLRFGDGEYYPVYVNRDGEMEFFYLERNEYAGGNGQLKTGYFIQDYGFSDLDTRYSEDMVCLGEAELTLRELPSLDVLAIEEDEYVTALKEYIEDMLRQNGRSGEYEMNIGEYEAPYKNRVCLSAAVTGEDDSYYFRYLIVKSGKGNYYFWPAGFGLNGSLAECEAGKHYMNALCIERTRQLGRCSIVIEVD